VTVDGCDKFKFSEQRKLVESRDTDRFCGRTSKSVSLTDGEML